MDTRRRRHRLVDKFALGVNFCVVLIAVVDFLILLRPTSLGIFLASFCGLLFKTLRSFSFFNLHLGRFIAEVMKLLQDQNLEYKNRVKGKASTAGPILLIVTGDLIENRTKGFSIDEITKLKDPDFVLGCLFLMFQSREQIPTPVLRPKLHNPKIDELSTGGDLRVCQEVP